MPIKQMLIHVWEDVETGEENIHEQSFKTSLEDSIKQYMEEDLPFMAGKWEYKHTLHISYNGEQSMVDEINIKACLPEAYRVNERTTNFKILLAQADTSLIGRA